MIGACDFKKGKPWGMVVLIFIIIALILTDIITLYHHDFEIQFEKVGEFDIVEKPINGGLGAFWIALRSPAYNGFFSNDILKNNFNIEFNEFDFNKYTYIVTSGYELKQISYSYDTMKNRKFIAIPKQFIGKVVLWDEYKDKIYIYKIPKMDIDCDFHERNREVYFFKKDMKEALQ